MKKIIPQYRKQILLWAQMALVVAFGMFLDSSYAYARVIVETEYEEIEAETFVIDSLGTSTAPNLVFGTSGAEISFDVANTDFVINQDINLDGNELKDFKIENLAAAPACGASDAGKLYYDTGINRNLFCDGATWQTFSGGSLLDEDDMISDSDAFGATQQSIKAYVDGFLSREMTALSDGKYVLRKDGGAITFQQIINENPGGDNLFGEPGQVTGLSLVGSLQTEITISWAEPSNGGIALTDYLIQFREVGDVTWLDTTEGVSLVRSTTATGLTADTNYEFRVRTTNGSVGPWSDVFTTGTKPNIPFFDAAFEQAINTAGATQSQVVAFEDTTVIQLNDAPLVTLNKGQTHLFTSAQHDIIKADKPIFVAGELGSANRVWNRPEWAGEQFTFNTNRSDPQQLTVYGFENASITLSQGATTIQTSSVTAGNSVTLSWNGIGSYQLTTTGLVSASHVSNSNTDARPIIPASTDIIGFPSSSADLSAEQDSTDYTGYHSNSVVIANSLSAATKPNIGPQGTSSLYQGESLRIVANKPIAAASYADSNGSEAAPFIPVANMKTRYAVNVATEWVAFASLEAGTIQVLDSTDTVLQTLTLTRSGSELNAPFKVRANTLAAGTRFVATVPVAGWYEPSTDTAAVNDDETVMFGY